MANSRRVSIPTWDTQFFTSMVFHHHLYSEREYQSVSKTDVAIYWSGVHSDRSHPDGEFNRVLGVGSK